MHEGQISSLQATINHAESQKQSTQEIPEQINRVGSLLSETTNLLAALHQKLASVMPPSAPEPAGTLTGGTREPSTPLGNQLADFARIAGQNNSSLRYLLERIKL